MLSVTGMMSPVSRGFNPRIWGSCSHTGHIQHNIVVSWHGYSAVLSHTSSHRYQIPTISAAFVQIEFTTLGILRVEGDSRLDNFLCYLWSGQ